MATSGRTILRYLQWLPAVLVYFGASQHHDAI
jgi:hypothetical protein